MFRVLLKDREIIGVGYTYVFGSGGVRISSVQRLNKVLYNAFCVGLNCVYCFALSGSKIVGLMDVYVQCFVNEFVSVYHIEGLTKVYCCNKCSKSNLCCDEPSRIFCAMRLRRVFFEWLGLKPCWAGESGRCGVKFCSIHVSSIL